MEKSYVGMSICPICQEIKEILLDRRLKNTLHRKEVILPPCDKCIKKYLKKGVLLIEKNTGNLAVIKNKAFLRLFDVDLPKAKIVFVEDGLLEKVGILKKTEA